MRVIATGRDRAREIYEHLARVPTPNGGEAR